MLSDLSEAERWEQGSRDDPMRNSFVIPQLVRIIEAHQPNTILDVGAGTGYIARTIDGFLSYRPRWTLIDLNEQRLAVAKACQPAGMTLEAITGNVFDWPFANRRFGSVLITFTLLEIEDIDRLCSLVASHLDEGSVLSLVMPDAWMDVVEYSRTEPSIVEQYACGPVMIPKWDKFTGKEYPFRATRIEDLISRVLSAGFNLVELHHGLAQNAGAFVLAFRRRVTADG